VNLCRTTTPFKRCDTKETTLTPRDIAREFMDGQE
jgi:hypothetical protein